MLKLHLYGYISGIRSSRKLSAACHDSLSLIWLIGGITPSKSSETSDEEAIHFKEKISNYEKKIDEFTNLKKNDG